MYNVTFRYTQSLHPRLLSHGHWGVFTLPDVMECYYCHCHKDLLLLVITLLPELTAYISTTVLSLHLPVINSKICPVEIRNFRLYSFQCYS